MIIVKELRYNVWNLFEQPLTILWFLTTKLIYFYFRMVIKIQSYISLLYQKYMSSTYFF